MARTKTIKMTDEQAKEAEADMQAVNMGFPDMSGGASTHVAEAIAEVAADVGPAPELEATTTDPATDPAADPTAKEKMLAEVIATTVDEITRFMPSISDAEDRLESASEEQKKAKKGVEAVHAHLAMLCRRLADAKNGNYQPHLPFGTGDGGQPGDAPTKRLPLVDEGARMQIEELAQHGLTEKMCEKLREYDIKTIGDLESMMRADEWWHRKIKGFGGERIDKTIDALSSFRHEFPVPDPDDVDEWPEDAVVTITEVHPADDVPAAP